MIGSKIRKKFPTGYFEGTVVSFKKPYYMVHYTDGDKEGEKCFQIEDEIACLLGAILIKKLNLAAIL